MNTLTKEHDRPCGIARWIKDPYCGLSHAVGALLSLVGMILLIGAAWGVARSTVAAAVYGASLVLLYTASALAHSIHCSPRASWHLDQLDYMAIFLLIAGTYTPICLGPLWGPWGWTLLSIEWGLAAVGIFSVLFMTERAGWLRIGLYAAMAWLVVVALGPLSRAVPFGWFAWLFAGGLFYSIGAVIFATQRPRLWPGRFGYHDLWHTLVLGGSACHFVIVARSLA